MRLDGNPYERIAQAIEALRAAGRAYALAVGRLGERLAFVSALERRGISPPDRQVLGHVRFFREAQDVASRLRLNQEAVDAGYGCLARAPPDHGGRS